MTVSAPPTGLDECLFCISLVLDPLAVRFSVSPGCARRRSVSTYATILVLPECLFFISLVVRFPCSSIFCQFWLVFVFKLLLSFFWLCEEVQCVYLCLHLGQEPIYRRAILFHYSVSYSQAGEYAKCFLLLILLEISFFPSECDVSSHFAHRSKKYGLI